ncbi:hypothetical protein BDY19DRAFT_140875 [Irpex rosettiformis]|uniref:Uncharacterized protein n=1 Tax=Irpex rosettiformis TaxID=378272 RepID=A0ACB8U586_9APHY|nr:hypothetical protein BDY19DRAFT_140875 [Irpex rosettiformis]
MKTSPPTSPAAHIYAEQLFQKGHGYSLWFPEHATSFEGVHIGDIGYVRGGSFQCVFNATLPANHPANSNGVPTSFAPLKYNATSLTHTKEAYLPDRAVSSQTMKSIDRSAWAGMNSPMSPIGGESLISYKCVSHKGAILLLNEGGTTQETLLPNSNFPAYMLEHYDSWYKLAKEQEHDIEPEDLVMVKGTVKASDWTVAAFYDKSKHRSFKVEARGIPYVGAGLSFTNSKVSTEYRTTRSEGEKLPIAPRRHS